MLAFHLENSPRHYIYSTLKKTLTILGIITLLTGLLLNFTNIFDRFSPASDISGEWYFIFHTKESSYKDYVNSVTEYKIHLSHDNSTVKGKGEKWKYNGEEIDYSMHRALEINGTFKKNVFKFTFILHGGQRKTTGSVKAHFKDGKIFGTFSGTAADTKGKFYGKMINE